MSSGWMVGKSLLNNKFLGKRARELDGILKYTDPEDEPTYYDFIICGINLRKGIYVCAEEFSRKTLIYNSVAYSYIITEDIKDTIVNPEYNKLKVFLVGSAIKVKPSDFHSVKIDW